MRNLVVSLVAASILTASSLAAADEPAPIASAVIAPATPALAALPIIAPPAATPPLGRAEPGPAIATEPRIRSRALVYGGIGATAGGLAILSFGIWAASRPASPPCPSVSNKDPLATAVLGGLEVACNVGEGANEALRTAGVAATIVGGLGAVAGVTMLVVGAGPARPTPDHALLAAPTLSVGPRSAALRWTF
ncbi:MAG: hypothetical protein ABJE95_22335 [Byssovorax sp.]